MSDTAPAPDHGAPPAPRTRREAQHPPVEVSASNLAEPVPRPFECAERPDGAGEWDVVLGCDGVNTRGYVIAALVDVFGCGRERAAQLMLEAVTFGETVAWSGSRERAEGFAHALHVWNLAASVRAA